MEILLLRTRSNDKRPLTYEAVDRLAIWQEHQLSQKASHRPSLEGSVIAQVPRSLRIILR